jgi:hypothetical protein
MTSTAVSSANSHVYIETADGASKTITAITKANPCVVTSATHGLAVGTVVVISGVVGMTELNGRAAVITAQDTNTFTLGGIDSTNYTTYGSAGAALPKTMTEVENVKSWDRPGNPAAEIDVTNLASTARERISGLADRGTVTMALDIDDDGPGQVALRKAVGGVAKAMKVVRGDGKSFAVMVSWNNFGDSLGIDAAHSGSATGYISTDYAWFA